MSRPRFLADHDLALVIDSLVLIWAASEAEEWENQVRFLPL